MDKALIHMLNQGIKTMPLLLAREQKGNADEFIVNCQEFSGRY